MKHIGAKVSKNVDALKKTIAGSLCLCLWCKVLYWTCPVMPQCKGSFPSIDHNEIRDLTAHLLTEVSIDVCIEPELQPIDDETSTGTSSYSQDGARLDIAASGFWGGYFKRTFFDVWVFNPHASSNNHPCCYRRHKLEKKCHYEQRVREVEHASFTPLVLSATGGMANEATVFYRRLASCLATKWDHPYSSTMSWLQCRLTFSLLRSSIKCIRGARASYGHTAKLQTPPWTWSYLNLILLSFLSLSIS